MDSREVIGMEHLLPNMLKSSAVGPKVTSNIPLLRANAVQDAK